MKTPSQSQLDATDQARAERKASVINERARLVRKARTRTSNIAQLITPPADPPILKIISHDQNDPNL